MEVMRILYLQFDMVCQSSLLTLILRSVSGARGEEPGTSEDCVTAARAVMDIHHQCMASVKSCKGDPTMVKKYMNW